MAPNELPHTSLSWETPFSDAIWARATALVAAGAVETPSAQDDVSVIELGPGLPTSDEARVTFVSLVHVHDSATLRWHLQLIRAPEGAPPSEVVEADAAFGGLEGLKALVTDSLPEAQASTTLRATATLSATRWRCPIIGEALAEFEGPVRRLGAGPLREQVGYRFQDGPYGLSEVVVVYDHVRSRYHLTVLAGMNWHPEATGWIREDKLLIDLMVESLFAFVEAE